MYLIHFNSKIPLRITLNYFKIILNFDINLIIKYINQVSILIFNFIFISHYFSHLFGSNHFIKIYLSYLFPYIQTLNNCNYN